MKNLSNLLVLFLIGIQSSIAALPAEDRGYRGYNNSFIFQDSGIEFAVFPDGQFDFNYLDNGPNFNIGFNTPNASFSFNTGFNYDRYVQYDTYGAVIQIENVPVFYDPYGRVNQIGDIFIDYRNGFVNRIGNLNVFYSRPGVIVNYTGFINTFNYGYVYRPWHDFYAVPIVDRRILWNNPYRRFYNPVRFSWNYHRNYWNRPGYYNGCFVNVNVRRDFYRPYHRVDYRRFERGRRDSRGRAVAYNSRSRTERTAVVNGRREVKRSANDRSAATRSDVTLSRTRSNNRRAVAARSDANRRSQVTRSRATNTVESRNNSRTNGTVSENRSNRSNRSNTVSSSSRNSRFNRAVGSTSSRREAPATVSNRSQRSNSRATYSRSAQSKPTASSSTRSRRTSETTQSRSSRANASSSNNSRRSSSKRSSRRSI
ncbi:MAG: hypothetical protein WBG46_00290 [Nonlabens sp.]